MTVRLPAWRAASGIRIAAHASAERMRISSAFNLEVKLGQTRAIGSSRGAGE